METSEQLHAWRQQMLGQGLELVHHTLRLHALCCYVQKTVLLKDVLETAKRRVSPHMKRILQSKLDTLPKREQSRCNILRSTGSANI